MSETKIDIQIEREREYTRVRIRRKQQEREEANKTKIEKQSKTETGSWFRTPSLSLSLLGEKAETRRVAERVQHAREPGTGS